MLIPLCQSQTHCLCLPNVYMWRNKQHHRLILVVFLFPRTKIGMSCSPRQFHCLLNYYEELRSADKSNATKKKIPRTNSRWPIRSGIATQDQYEVDTNCRLYYIPPWHRAHHARCWSVFNYDSLCYRQYASEMVTTIFFSTACKINGLYVMENSSFTCSISKWNDIRSIMLTKGWKVIEIQNRNMRIT